MGILSNRLKERGSDRCSQGNWGRDSDGELMLEAADEIERLRKALERYACECSIRHCGPSNCECGWIARVALGGKE